MLRAKYVGGAVAALAAAVWLAGCSNSPTTISNKSGDTPDSTATESHGHVGGARGGVIASLGRDEYHVEAIVTADGELRLFAFGREPSEVQEAPIQPLTAYVKAAGGGDYEPVTLQARPQPGDAVGKTSLFVGRLMPEFVGKELSVTVPNFAIGEKRFRLSFTTSGTPHDSPPHDPTKQVVAGAPAKVTSEAERTLYLTPAGLYTWADIDANGKLTGSQKFANFEASHNLDPKPGEKICPITLTKANPNCSWIVGGKSYLFCCPPCVDEFVKLAKEKPGDVKPPGEYVERIGDDAATESPNPNSN